MENETVEVEQVVYEEEQVELQEDTHNDLQQIHRRNAAEQQPDDMEKYGFNMSKFLGCLPLPQTICCGCISLKQALIAIAVCDVTASFTSVVIFIYMSFGISSLKNKYYLYLTFTLRLFVNILLGIVAAVGLCVTSCSIRTKCFQNCYL